MQLQVVFSDYEHGQWNSAYIIGIYIDGEGSFFPRTY